MFRTWTIAALLACMFILPLYAQQRAPANPQQVKTYTLTPDKLEKARSYSHWQYGLHFLGVLWAVGTLAAILKYRFAPRVRAWAEGATRRRFVQAALFVPVLLLAIDVARIPLDALAHGLGLRYGQSVQGWASWLWDWIKGEAIEMVIAIVLVWILYGAIRQSPTGWWFRFWLASLPILVFLLFIQPLVIEPMFFQFEPLVVTQPNLVDALEKVVARGGLAIPLERIFLMKASAKLNSINAYVAGIGASKRVVVWDTAVARLSQPQILFVFGHEMGHYVLDHIPKEIVFLALVLLLALYAGYRGTVWALDRWGRDWDIRGVEDWASLPLLLLVVTLFSFFSEPVTNSVSRYFEHEADIYGLEVTFGLFPLAAETAAEAFQILGENGLAEPDPYPLVELWLYSHPSISRRVKFAQQYDPSKKEENRFVH